MAGIGERYANVFTDEGVAVSANVTLPFSSGEIVLTNDSSTKNLILRVAGSDITLLPTETLTLRQFRAKDITLFGDSVPYRLWSFS